MFSYIPWIIYVSIHLYMRIVRVMSIIWYYIARRWTKIFVPMISLREIERAKSQYKEIEHVGYILSFENPFGRNRCGIDAVSRLIALSVVIGVKFMTIFLPYKLDALEKQKILKRVTFYHKQFWPDLVQKNISIVVSILERLSAYTPEDEDKILEYVKYLVEKKKQFNAARALSAEPITSWGLLNHKLKILTEFESFYGQDLDEDDKFYPRIPVISNFCNNNYTESITAEKLSTCKDSIFEKNDNPPTEYELADTVQITFSGPEDSKDSLVQLTRLLARGVLRDKLSPANIDQALIHAILTRVNGKAWPENKVIINFNSHPFTCGYPAWQLRYPEIVCTSPLAEDFNSMWAQLDSAFLTYSRTVQRYGK
ncbi:uncharacterized protein LOC126315453 [Schistocerca gregaria]|uniref:uncharacterized protein LOC126315453 n=1 Tax=Schistocerca gregaria TaxID=7010 RepID=UPI00211E59B1|nr:uncharacterized protein LOC126315453 [Schistocerca gregaria]XP_049848659.1 uncharacterized protein LOC126315453 [Schistocerca gregaria]